MPVVRSTRRRDFLGHHRKSEKPVRTERRAGSNVRRVASSGDQHAADAGSVVARIERVPGAAEENFEPGREVHWRRVWRHPDIPQTARAVPRRDVHAAAEGNREMGKVPAHAKAAVIGLQSRPGGTGVLIPKGKVLAGIVANCLDPRPAGGRLAEQRPRRVGQPVGLAISGWTAGKPKPRRAARRPAVGCVGGDNIRSSRVAHQPDSGERISPLGAGMRLQRLPNPSW